jgi:hypothetical protein
VRRQIVNRVFILLSFIIVGACLLFAYATSG